MSLTGWTLAFLACLVFFTALKFPETRVKALVLGRLNAALASKNISIEPETTKIQFGLGISLLMESAVIHLPAPAAPITIDRIRVRPSLLPLLFRKISAAVELTQGEGSLELSVNLPMGSATGGSTPISFAFDASDLNLAALGAGSFMGNFPVFGVISGEGSFAGDLNSPETWQGEAELSIDRLRTDAQQVAGFQIPGLTISELKAELAIDTENKKIRIESFRFGKSGGSDDLSGTLSGDLALAGRGPGQLPLNVTAKFSLSEKIRREIVLLDAILGPGKQSDGSYAYKIGGTLGAPFPSPIPGSAQSGTGAGP